MHICFLCNEYPPGIHGGIGSFTQDLARSLVKRGHQVTVIGVYINRISLEDDQGVNIIRLRSTSIPKTGFIINGIRLRRVLADIQRINPIDIIEGPENSMALISSRSPFKVVIRMNGGHHFFAQTLGKTPKIWRRWLEKRSFARADHITAVSYFVANETRRLLNLGNRHIEILPNPVDVGYFKPQKNISEEDNLIVFAGTVCEKKGVRQLILAMPQIVEACPEARLWIVGRDWCDPQTGRSFIDELQQIIPVYLQDKVVFKGPVERSELPELLAQASVCAFPSHMESFGIVWVEGMAMSKATIGSRLGPGPEVIEDGVSGLLCDPYDPDSIARQIITVLKDAELRKSLSSAARLRAVEEFSVDTLVIRNEKFYQQCLGL